MSWSGTLEGLAREGRITRIPDPAAALEQHQTVEMHQAQPLVHRDRPAAVLVRLPLRQIRPSWAVPEAVRVAMVLPAFHLGSPTKAAAAAAAAAEFLGGTQPMPAAYPGFLRLGYFCWPLAEQLAPASPRQHRLRRVQSGAAVAALEGHRV